MDETKSETQDNPDWHPETWGGLRSPIGGRPTLGGEEDPTVTVTVMMPLSLKKAAIEIGGGNMSRGIREALGLAMLYQARYDCS